MNFEWFWQLPVLIVLLSLQVVYWRGRREMTRLLDGERPTYLSKTNLTLFLVSQLALVGALLTPLNRLATELFLFHVAQHLLLAAVTPAFFWFSDPMPVIKRGLPAGWQRAIDRYLAPGTILWDRIKMVTPQGASWLFFVTIVWFWYDSIVHIATLTRPWLHLLELATVYLAANIYWWHISGSAPKIHKPLPTFIHMIFALGGAWPIKAIGAGAIFTERIIYDYPVELLNQWGMSAIDNQMWGGILIWGFGGIAFTTSAGFFLRRWLAVEEDKPVKLLDELLTDENMLAPGIKRKTALDV